MIVTDLQVNHMQNPVGYKFETLHFQWKVRESEGKFTKNVHFFVMDDADTIVADEMLSEAEVSASGCVERILPLKPYTRYQWNVEVESDIGEHAESETAFFETAKMVDSWTAKWLLAEASAKSAVFEREFQIRKPVKQARLYICGYGLYEVYINGKKMGDEVLLPGYHSYDLTNEYQTIDVTDALERAEYSPSTISFMLGNGWYKGRFVFDGGFENLYGDRQKVIAELHIIYADGEQDIIATDESWRCHTSYIVDNGIYDGEVQDYTAEGNPLDFTTEEPGGLLTERTSLPLREVETVSPKSVIYTPSGDAVLDFGEMITGWVSFWCKEEKDKIIRLQYGEWMQNGEFYRDNLRTAKAEFSYRSTGEKNWVRPHFTFYGFRYVRVEGISDIQLSDFCASRIRSACQENGKITTGNQKVNRLIANAYASQQCNFLDIPTDCPQRDERMGWTGDIAIFADTACFNMDSAAFLQHFMDQLQKEQDIRDGSVPFVVPFPKAEKRENVNPFFIMPATCAWGDVVTIVPYAMYEHYGDLHLLRKNYKAMKGWVDYVNSRTMENKIPHLWQNDFQLGDWLALDSQHPQGLLGLTDTGLIASAYYFHSTELTKKAAEILDYVEDAQKLEEELEAIRKEFWEYYFDENGNLTVVETQTAYAVLLAFGLCPKVYEQKSLNRLRELIDENNGHLSTGFVGTPLLCETLSCFGAHETACRLFLNEEYPGWLYEVNLGAVTIWERWNSVNPDGMITSTEMNSLNHYAFGSIVAWVYRYLCGFQPLVEEKNTLIIQPMYCKQLGFIDGVYTAPWGTYRSFWKETEDGKIEYTIEVPYDGTAIVKLGGYERRLDRGIYTFSEAVHKESAL